MIVARREQEWRGATLSDFRIAPSGSPAREPRSGPGGGVAIAGRPDGLEDEPFATLEVYLQDLLRRRHIMDGQRADDPAVALHRFRQVGAGAAASEMPRIVSISGATGSQALTSALFPERTTSRRWKDISEAAINCGCPFAAAMSIRTARLSRLASARASARSAVREIAASSSSIRHS